MLVVKREAICSLLRSLIEIIRGWSSKIGRAVIIKDASCPSDVSVCMHLLPSDQKTTTGSSFEKCTRQEGLVTTSSS